MLEDYVRNRFPQLKTTTDAFDEYIKQKYSDPRLVKRYKGVFNTMSEFIHCPSLPESGKLKIQKSSLNTMNQFDVLKDIW